MTIPPRAAGLFAVFMEGFFDRDPIDLDQIKLSIVRVLFYQTRINCPALVRVQFQDGREEWTTENRLHFLPEGSELLLTPITRGSIFWQTMNHCFYSIAVFVDGDQQSAALMNPFMASYTGDTHPIAHWSNISEEEMNSICAHWKTHFIRVALSPVLNIPQEWSKVCRC